MGHEGLFDTVSVAYLRASESAPRAKKLAIDFLHDLSMSYRHVGVLADKWSLPKDAPVKDL